MKFNETLHLDGYRAFFNAPVESDQITNGVHVTTFKKTPLPLSTYLVAFIIAPFAESPEPAYFDSSYNGENALKPFTTIGQAKYFSPKRQDLLSQIAGPAALNLMTKLTGVGYGYEKLTQAGIPDFAAGAMENWGLVTYREGYVFWYNATGSTSAKQGVATVTTHELAHQWFGDLVTLHWWTDLWLNEGFATFFEFLGTDQFREDGLDTSDWDLVGQMVTGTLQGEAFIVDARASSRPLTSEAYDPDVIETFGDSISYAKGGSVLRMFLNILGEKLFYSGLNRYLNSQEESVGTPEILLASWDGAIDSLPAEDRPNYGRTLSSLLHGWHAQAGYPVVSVRFDTLTASLYFSQKRFLSSTGNDSARWNVPLTYSTDVEDNFNLTAPFQFLYDDIYEISFPLKNAAADWVVVNNQQTGYYRVNYDTVNWNKLLNILSDPDQYQKIHPYNRAQILDDADALGASTHEDYLPYNIALRLLQSIKHDRRLVVWTAAVRIMKELLLRVDTTSAFDECSLSLKNYFLELIEPAFSDLSLYVAESDTHTRKLLRSLVAEFACGIGLTSCQQQARGIFASNVVHPDVRKVALCERVKQGGKEAWLLSREQAAGPQSPEQMDHLLALTCSQDQNLLKQLLNELSVGSIISNEEDTIDALKELADKSPSKSPEVFKVLTTRRWRKFNDMKAKNLAAELFATASFYDSSIQMENESAKGQFNHLKAWTAAKKPQICSFLLNRIHEQA